MLGSVMGLIVRYTAALISPTRRFMYCGAKFFSQRVRMC